MSISPNALGGWAGLMESLSKTLDVKTRDGIALAVSETDGCDDCLAAHSYVSTNLAKSPEEIALSRQGRSGDPKRQAAVAFAKAVLEARGGVSDAQYDAGWADANIVEMIALTAQFLLTNSHGQRSADADRSSGGQSPEGSLTRGAFLWRGEGWRIQYVDGPRGLVSSASTRRPRPRTA